MPDMKKIRDGVIRSLPEISEISNRALRDQVVEAWTLALSETSFSSLDQLTCSANLGRRNYPGKTQAHHIRGVACMARAMAREMLQLENGDIGVDPELALVGGLVHDIGKPYMYDPANHKRWQSDSRYTGDPPLRHTAYGAHIALKAGLPEEIVHVVAMHEMNREGQYGARSVYVELVSYADYAYWAFLNAMGLLNTDPTPIKEGVYY